MRYHTAAAFQAAIDARLKVLGKERGQQTLSRARKQIAFDRFLARLIVIAPQEWIRKGGPALEYRIGDRARTTVDIDLLHDPDRTRVVAVLRAAESAAPGDYFSFTVQRTNKLDRLTDGAAVRYRIRADLDGRRFENFVVDVGFDAPGPFPPDVLRRGEVLSFADILSPPILTLPIEVHLAAKLHAYSRIVAGGNSTRVKDLVDIVLIGTTQILLASRCRAAFQHTVASWRGQALPHRFESSPEAWTIPYQRLAKSVSLDPGIAAGHACAAELLDPLLTGQIEDGATWQPDARAWRHDPAGLTAEMERRWSS